LIKPVFNGNSYETKGDNRVIWDKLLLNSRWYFVYGYAKEIINGRKLAQKGQYDSQKWVDSSYNIAKDIEKSGGKLFINGMENISKVEGPVVFVSNHMSNLETFVFPCIIEPIKSVTYVVKESLVVHPIFGPVMRSRDPIVLARKNPREDLVKVLKEGVEKLRSGKSIILFPEGSRKTEFNPDNFNSLGVKLAKEAGVPVIPVAINAGFWGLGKVIKDVGPINRKDPVCITFGEPINISGNGKAEHKQIIDFIGDNIKKFKQIKI
jgi:1-acyl-sn-glycerol-3-phosphate acyltransferase